MCICQDGALSDNKSLFPKGFLYILQKGELPMKYEYLKYFNQEHKTKNLGLRKKRDLIRKYASQLGIELTGDFNVVTVVNNLPTQFFDDDRKQRLKDAISDQDFATFSEGGGNIYYSKAQRIVTNAQNAPEKGWKAFENDRNRYWIANNMLESRYSDYQSTMYRYHRLGMDKLAEEPDDARYEITDALESLRSIYRENSSAFILQLFFDAKSEEITKIYSGAFPNEQARIIKTLIEIDPSRSSKYQDIVKQSEIGR